MQNISLRLRAYNTSATVKVVKRGEVRNYFEGKGSEGQSELIPIDEDTVLVITVTEVGITTGTTIYTINTHLVNIAPTITITPSTPQTLQINTMADIIVSLADDNFNLKDIVILETMSSSQTIVSVTPARVNDIMTNTMTTFTLSAEQSEEATITFTATDNGGLSDSETVLVNVNLLASTIRIRAKVFLESPLQ